MTVIHDTTIESSARVIGLVLGDYDVDEAEIDRALSGVGAKAHFLAGEAARFVDLVESLSPDRVPSPAWVEQARRNAADRDALLSEFGALDAEVIADLAGSTAKNRRALAQRWRSEGRIFGVEIGNKIYYPAFQFDQRTSRPKEAIALVLRVLPPQLRSGRWQLALWWTNAIDVLKWRRPVDVIDGDPALVVSAAQAEAADWKASAPLAE
jgi:hypothetical protein